MATLTPVATSPSTLVATPTAVAATAGGGDVVANPKGNVYLLVTNGGGGSINVTVAAGASPNRPADATFPLMVLGNLVTAVPAGEQRLIGPLPKAYNNSSNQVVITYSGVTSVTVVAIQP